MEAPGPETPPAPPEWSELAAAAAGCRACPLWEPATATVFGEGPVPARLMLVGEQPGDQEDRTGRPFVGPAGRVLDEALVAQGATAAMSLLGPSFRLTRHRGEVTTGTGLAAGVMATTHPSLVLRGSDPDTRASIRREMVADLAEAASLL